MPAWITPLLWVLVSIPGRRWRSAIQTVTPLVASAAVVASPITPPPTTRTSMSSGPEGPVARGGIMREALVYRVAGAEKALTMPQPDDQNGHHSSMNIPRLEEPLPAALCRLV